MLRGYALIIAFACATQVAAHDTWLVPDRFTVRPGETVSLQMTSGMEFPKLDYGIKPDRVGRAVVMANGKTVDLTPKAGEHALRFNARLRSAGVNVVAVDLKPKDIELKPDQVAEYLDEIGADSSLRDEWKKMAPQRWREIYTKHAKTFVRVGRTDDSWREPAGLALEIVPLSDPTSVPAGASLMILLLENGRPLPDFSIGVVREGETKGSLVKTDGNGQATIAVTQPGRYLVRATHVRRADRPDADWVSDFTTMTFSAR